MSNTRRQDLIDWAHDYAVQLMAECLDAGLQPDDLVVVATLAQDFVRRAHPDAQRSQQTQRHAQSLARTVHEVQYARC